MSILHDNYQKDDVITAELINALIAEAKRKDGGIAAEPGEIALFQIANAIEFPASAADGNVPFSEDAARVEYDVSTPSAPVYAVPVSPEYQTIYFPAYRTDSGDPVGTPPFAVGDRVWARLNSENDQWEAIEPAMRVVRFEMTAALSPGGNASAISFWYDDAGDRYDGPSITVHDALGCFSKMATTSGDTGAMGVALWMPDKARWEIVAMQTPCDFWGTLDGELHHYDLGQDVSVNVTGGGWADGKFSGYDVFQTNHGLSLTAYNTRDESGTGGVSGRSGDIVLCRWNGNRGRYEIVYVQPNDLDWTALDVCMYPALSINFSAESYTLSWWTREIKIPYWSTIGAATERFSP